jgi:SAM-dependent methyltransferase
MEIILGGLSKENKFSKAVDYLNFHNPTNRIIYRCNICGRICHSYINDIGREKPSCACGSTVRSRAIVHLLSILLFGESIALPDFPKRPDITGWGMSDAGYSEKLQNKLNYLNTFYHQEPKFDISEPLDPSYEKTLDFLISTEVFEHIAPPVSRSFENAFRLLKPTGALIFSVPYNLEKSTIEHFPDLYDYSLDKIDNNFLLSNKSKDGKIQTYDHLVFHGGPGTTLEMRVFSESGLFWEFEKAGFSRIRILTEPYLKFGIYLQDNWSLPLIAYPC